MGVKQSFSDTANQLKAESTQISVRFEKGNPTQTSGTLFWTIPKPAIGCGVDSLQYSGVVVAVKNSPFAPSDVPSSGTVYTADPTANPQLHAGDKIGDALVVGAYYEQERRFNQQPFTTSTVVTDLSNNTPYYFCVFPVDAQFRYFLDGIRSYSDEITKGDADPSLPSTQTIEFQTLIIGSTGTNLTPGFTYTFDFILDRNYDYKFSRKRDPRTSPTAEIFTVSIDGTAAGTYDDLLVEIRKQISLIGNPITSPVPPNSGMLYWNSQTKTLYQFDGSQHVVIEGVLFETTNPASIVVGTLWFNPETKELKSYNTGWIGETFTQSPFDPTTTPCSEYWFNGTQGYRWNNTTWCEVTTLIQPNDPSCATINCGAFWFNETTSILNKWNNTTQQWIPTSAITWDVAPTSLVDGTYWFDLSSNKLFTRSLSSWNEETQLFISETTPTLPAPGSFWFQPSTEDLKQWNGTTYIALDCIVWNTDPADVTSCDLWWRSTDDVLLMWDVVHSQWDVVQHFSMSQYDPHLAPSIDDGVLWVDPSGNIVIWESTKWAPLSPILSLNDPTIPSVGSFWYDTSEMQMNQWNGSSWDAVDPIDTINDPSIITNGTYWFNPSNSVLSVRNGAMWLAASYATRPLTPSKGELWFDSSQQILKEWNGTAWIDAAPIILAEIKDGKIIFTSKDVGANVYLGIDKDVNNTLFPALQPKATIWTPTLGGDGRSNVPPYAESGVGTDNSPDERRLVMDNIRRRLGAPAVDVELDQHTLNLCIDKAIEILRQRSMIYKRGFFFIDIVPRSQVYRLTNRQLGYHKIVSVMSCHRFTSAFLTSAHGSGAYGQVVLQQLYSMGTYDLTSYHLIAQYIEQMEMLFSTRISYSWDEASRELTLYHSFYTHETMLLDCTVERTEQEMMTDRFMKPWIEKWALAEAMFTLSQIRGKFSTLPGAGGGITLNAGDLSAASQSIKEQCMSEIDDYIVSRPDDLGIESQFIIG